MTPRRPVSACPEGHPLPTLPTRWFDGVAWRDGREACRHCYEAGATMDLDEGDALMMLCSNSELVAISWLGGVTGLTLSMVAATVPKDNSGWLASGFATVRTVANPS